MRRALILTTFTLLVLSTGFSTKAHADEAITSRTAVISGETTGYQVHDLAATLEKAKAAGVRILFAPYTAQDRTTAIVQFPGGYIAEIHSLPTR